MPVWIYFSFLMAPADVWGILDFLSASIAQLAPLGEVLEVGDVCVVSLHFDLRTLLPLGGDCSHSSHSAPDTTHHIRFSAFAISPSALLWQHLERVLVSVKLSAPLSVGKVCSDIRYLWHIQHFHCVCQSSWDAASIMNSIVWITNSLISRGGNHLSWHWQPKPHPQHWWILLNVKLILRKPALCYSQLVQSIDITRWIKGQEEQICHELALNCPAQIPCGFCWGIETSLWIFEIFWFSWQFFSLTILETEILLVLYSFFTRKSLYQYLL